MVLWLSLSFLCLCLCVFSCPSAQRLYPEIWIAIFFNFNKAKVMVFLVRDQTTKILQIGDHRFFNMCSFVSFWSVGAELKIDVDSLMQNVAFLALYKNLRLLVKAYLSQPKACTIIQHYVFSMHGLMHAKKYKAINYVAEHCITLDHRSG